MAKITAKGTMEYFGDIEIVIEGEKYVEKITCEDDDVRAFFEDRINAGAGELANSYHPEPKTMLQALACLIGSLWKADIETEGDIGELECEEGVIY